MNDKNIVWHKTNVSQLEREKLLGQKPFVLWFTGLSGSGKSTIASQVEHILHDSGYLTYILDGDNIRHGLNKDLGFSSKDRVENIRRIAEVAKLMTNSGLIVLVSFITPFKKVREFAKSIIGKQFHEIFIDTPLAVCEARDVKGLYKLAREGEIKDFTGIDSPYEIPVSPEIHVETADKTIDECTEKIINYLKNKELLQKD
jgi:adenylylsulfate kinase